MKHRPPPSEMTKFDTAWAGLGLARRGDGG